MVLTPPDWVLINESKRKRIIKLNSVPLGYPEEHMVNYFRAVLPDLSDRPPRFEYRPNGDSNIVYITFSDCAQALHVFQAYLSGKPEAGGWANFVPMEADIHTSEMTVCISGIPRQATTLDIIKFLKNFSEDVPSVELKSRGNLTLDAFVTFLNVSSVERLTASQGMYILGAYANVSRASLFKMSPGYPLADAVKSVRTIIVSDLLMETTKEDVMDKFGDQAVYIELAWLGITAMAYVTFTSPAAANEALSSDGSHLGEIQISVKRAYFCPSHESSYVAKNTVMVQGSSNLVENLFQKGISTEDILTVFQAMGLNEVPYIDVYRDVEGNEVAYATFSNNAVADHVKTRHMRQVKEGVAVFFKNSIYFDPPDGEVTDVPYFGVNDEIHPEDIFPIKLYKVLRMERFNEIVVWVPGGGNLIQIRNLAKFKTDVLPSQFDNMTFAVFKSRLKDYEFRESSEKCTWYHTGFKDGAAEYAAHMVVVPKKTVADEVAGLADQVREYGKTMTMITGQMRELAPKVDAMVVGLDGCQARLTNVEERLGELAQDHM